MEIKSRSILQSDWIAAFPAAVIVLVLHLIAIKGYGYFRDELYYIACSDHLAFGYVDQPPLSIWILKGIRVLFGDSLYAVRALPVLSAAAWTFMTGLIAREFGGKRFAILLAGFTAMATLGNMVIFNFYSMNFLDLIIWQILFLLMIRLIKTGDPKVWIWIGVTAGVGLLNKISILFLGGGLFIGFLFTEHRNKMKSGYFWVAVGIAGLIFLPYIIWNAAHEWPMLEFMHNAKQYKMTRISPLDFFIQQVLYNNPANLLVWISGLVYLLFIPAGKPFRLFGWMFLAIYILFTIQSAKDYYLASAYPVLFAGGAALWERLLKNRIGLILRPVFILIPFSIAVLLSPLALAVLSADQAVRFIQKTGIEGNSGENHEKGLLPQHFADMHGWEELAGTIAGVYHQLTPEEQAGCIIYMRNYGEAGAVDFFGPKQGLPKASCSHNNYWFWGPPEWDGKVAIIYGWSQDVNANLEDLNRRFEDVKLAATFINPYCMPYENNRPVFICRNANFNFKEIWKDEKEFI